jgi:hypothetical protein
MFRILPPGFIAPCLPTKAHTPPSGGMWLHEIKHDGFRIIARKDGDRIRGNRLRLRASLLDESRAEFWHRDHSLV